MPLFHSEKSESNYLGVDIGGSSIKLVELANNRGRAQLVTYGYMERPLGGEGKRLLDDTDAVANAIRRVADSAKVTTKNAITALPATAVFSTILNLPEMSRKDLASSKKITSAVEYEAKKVLPLPVEEMILDWKVLGDVAGAGAASDQRVKNLQVLLTAAAKNVVQKYIDIFKRAGLNLLSLETESFALSRSLVGKDRSVVVMIDIGASDTDIIIVEGMIPYIDRSVNVGGYHMTKAMAQTMGIPLEQAEQFKRDVALYMPPEMNGKIVPATIEKMLAPVITEMKYLFDFFLKQPGNEGKRIDRLILSGGNALMFNVPKYMTSVFNIRAFLGNPWARVIYPEELQPLIDQIGARYAVAVGLAMRDIEK
jgi:type IV pilus assembly protein PilM